MSETRTAAPETTFRTKVTVHRREEGETAPRYDTFDVELGPSATVLDALVAIRRMQDPSLTFRHSCFHASCGTCAMRVDGQEGLACVTAIDGRTEVRVDPLANLPVVSDLVVEMTPFYDDFERSGRDLVRDSEALPEGRAGGRREAHALRGLHRVRHLRVGLPDRRQRLAVRGAGGARRGLARRVREDRLGARRRDPLRR
jgi:succinate dehydrogenase/fumarate reductase-like Fe-S protein